MGKNKLFSEETVTVDNCQCVYCGHVFSGRDACNNNMDVLIVTCPECEKDMDVYLSIKYICRPLED